MRGAVTPKQTVVGGFKGSEEGGWVIGGGLVGGEGGGLWVNPRDIRLGGQNDKMQSLRA
jgi:hypothetical protein